MQSVLRLIGLASVSVSALACSAATVPTSPPPPSDAGDAPVEVTTDASTSSVDSSDTGATLPACSWPASLDPTDAANGQCVAARALLSCPLTGGLTGGLTHGCISNDPTQCPSDGVQIGAPAGPCLDQCQANEYAIECGTIGPGNPDAAPVASPPTGCHGMLVTPGGIWFECCPCGS